MNNIKTDNSSKHNKLSKLQVLYSELKSEDHYEKTETLAYGKADPLKVDIATCDTCWDKNPRRQIVGEHNCRYIFVCSNCGKHSKNVQKRDWQAAIEWNMINLGTQNYRELPLFGLKNLSPSQTTERISGIRRNLELRKNIAELENDTSKETGKRPPGQQYQLKLDAYLRWSMLILRLAKYERQVKHQEQLLKSTIN